MNINLLFFGKLAEDAQKHLDCSELSIDVPISKDASSSPSLADVINHLSELSPELGLAIQKQGNLLACNQTICKTNASIADGDEIAFMSPLSGG